MVRNELRFRPTLGSDKLLTMTMRRVVKHSTTRSNTATKNPASFCRSVLLKSLLRIFPPAILVKLDDVEDHYSVCQLKIGSNCFHELLRIVLVKILLDIQAAVCRRDSFYHPHRDLCRAVDRIPPVVRRLLRRIRRRSVGLNRSIFGNVIEICPHKHLIDKLGKDRDEGDKRSDACIRQLVCPAIS